MAKKPVLVVMAAGMGSRYGGLKQLDLAEKRKNMAQEDVFKKVVSHCKEYGFVFPSKRIDTTVYVRNIRGC